MRDYSIECNLLKSKYIELEYTQNDTGVKLEVNVVEDTQDVDLTGCTIEARYKRPDKVVLKRNISNIEGNKFTAILDSEITAKEGTLKMSFTIKKDDVQLSTFLVLADIKECVSEDTSADPGTGTVSIPITIYDDETKTEKEITVSSTGELSEITLEEVEA